MLSRILCCLGVLIVRRLPLENMGAVLGVVADRLDQYRRQNSGYTPRSIFKSALEIGISYACLELVIWIDGGAMLKQRGGEAQGWSGMKHIPGVALMPYESLAEAQERLLGEFTEDDDLLEQLRTAFDNEPYIEVHREDTDPGMESRRVNCLTVVYSVILGQEDVSRLKDEFIFVARKNFGDESIVDHHQITLRQILKQ